jgi:dienelactone hydrolase
MRRFYIILAALFAASLIIFVASFFYLDKEKHRAYHYSIYLEDKEIGALKINRFSTEDKIVYKSASSIPFYTIRPDQKIRLSLGKDYEIDSYSKITGSGDSAEKIYIEKRRGGLEALSIFDSRFYYTSNIPVHKGTAIFENDSLLTYMPLVENYDFKRGRVQGFNSVILDLPNLPPERCLVTLTSVRDEYIKIGRRRMKTECLIVRIRNYPQTVIWISKRDRSIVKLEVPSKALKFMRTFKPRSLKPEETEVKKEGLFSRDASFRSGNVTLAGTITAPPKEGPLPAILLIWPDGPMDRQWQGLFDSMAAAFAKEGFLTLRFDKRGVGSSGGDFSGMSISEEYSDITSALGFLAAQKDVVPDRIAAIGLGRGAFYAAKAAAEDQTVKAAILMSPSISSDIEESPAFINWPQIAKDRGWSQDYLRDVSASKAETIEKVRNAKRDWIAVMGKRCFAGRLKEELSLNPQEVIKKLKAPVLILQGKEDPVLPAGSSELINKMLEDNGNTCHTLTYFSYLDQTFGKRINDGIHKISYQIDPSVIEVIKSWLNARLSEQAQK